MQKNTKATGYFRFHFGIYPILPKKYYGYFHMLTASVLWWETCTRERRRAVAEKWTGPRRQVGPERGHHRHGTPGASVARSKSFGCYPFALAESC